MSECGEKPLSKIFSRSPRIREDSLAKMPAEERVYRTLWMVEQASEHPVFVQRIRRNQKGKGRYYTILKCVVRMRIDCMEDGNREKLTSGLMENNKYQTNLVNHYGDRNHSRQS